jgi:serine protease DegQ
VVFEIVDGKASALTAAHCVEHQPTDQFDLTVNDKHAEVQVTNRILDLAIITFRARGESTILLATAAPAKGAEVAILGYAFGVEEIVAQFGRVAQPYNKETKALWINADLIFGDSGGALIDADGRLVGINSRIFTGGPFGQMAHIGGAVPLNAIEDFIDHYRKTKKDRK